LLNGSLISVIKVIDKEGRSGVCQNERNIEKISGFCLSSCKPWSKKKIWQILVLMACFFGQN